MPIVSYIDFYISALVNLIFYLYIAKTIFDLELQKNKMVIIYLLLAAIFVAIINLFNKDSFKVLLTFPFGVILFKKTFNIDYKKAVIYIIITTVYMFVGELMTSVVFSLLPFDYTFIFNNILGTTTGTIIVIIFTIPILYIKQLKLIVNKIETGIDDKSKALITLILILSIGGLAYKNSTGTVNTFNIIVNIVVTLTMLLIIYMYYKENVKSQELSKNYNILFNYLEKYEKELVEKRKITHDYKNQLIVIKGYIGKNKKLKEYIDELLQEQKNIIDNSIINNIDKLPSGLKGLIYYKIPTNNKIKIDISVLNSLKKFEKLSSKTNKEVLTIIGILLDNAIEAVESEKNKYINIEFSMNKNEFCMVLINDCTSKVDTKKLMEKGFSTKGKNRGYGLALVNDILKKNKAINLDFTLEDAKFISKLKVKL